MFKSKFWVSLLLTVPTLLYSPMVQEWLRISLPAFPGSRLVPAVFGSILFAYGGSIFLRGASSELRGRLPGMMTLISLAISVAFAYSLYATLSGSGTDFWWELATLITIMILGHWIEMRSVMSAQGALGELAKLLPDQAELIKGNDVVTVPVAQLVRGSVVLVRPGAKVPADGVIIEGESSLDESMITGESASVKKAKGGAVVAGTVNGQGSLKVRVSKVGPETALAGIMRLVEEAQASKSRAQILADRAAFYLTIIALSAGVITFIGWLMLTDRGLGFALERAVTVLVIACPHALGLAVPLVTAISTALAARNGLLVRQRMALESARNIDIVLFDKTGTLTKGKQGVVDAWSEADDVAGLIGLAASIEADSEHPIARAIVAEAKAKDYKTQKPSGFKALPGKGVEAQVEGKTVLLGGPQLLKAMGLSPSSKLGQAAVNAGRQGKTVVYVVSDRQILGAIALADVIRPESRQAVSQLQQSGVKVAMLTGDSEAVAAWVAKELGIDKYFAEVLPQHKADAVKQLQRDGSRVAMVGDGVNDAPALTQADIGLAIGAGTDVAIESAGIVLASDDPRGVLKVMRLSQATYRKMIQNLVWATGYNALAIPLAAGVLASYGVVLAPAAGAVLMSVSTVVVAINAQFLRGLRLAHNE